MCEAKDLGTTTSDKFFTQQTNKQTNKQTKMRERKKEKRKRKRSTPKKKANEKKKSKEKGCAPGFFLKRFEIESTLSRYISGMKGDDIEVDSRTSMHRELKMTWTAIPLLSSLTFTWLFLSTQPPQTHENRTMKKAPQKSKTPLLTKYDKKFLFLSPSHSAFIHFQEVFRFSFS